jgi:hypothetical protein
MTNLWSNGRRGEVTQDRIVKERISREYAWAFRGLLCSYPLTPNALSSSEGIVRGKRGKNWSHIGGCSSGVQHEPRFGGGSHAWPLPGLRIYEISSTATIVRNFELVEFFW